MAKELSIEQKAQRYDKAIERARALYDNNQPISGNNVIINNIFPELKESEDEVVKKEIVSAINLYCSDYLRGTKVRNDMLDWIERQGEQREQLIDKACNILVDCIEDYMSRRMETWNEESKKQTLENIRKKLGE